MVNNSSRFFFFVSTDFVFLNCYRRDISCFFTMQHPTDRRQHWRNQHNEDNIDNTYQHRLTHTNTHQRARFERYTRKRLNAHTEAFGTKTREVFSVPSRATHTDHRHHTNTHTPTHAHTTHAHQYTQRTRHHHTQCTHTTLHAVSSNQSLTHGQSFTCFCENGFHVDQFHHHLSGGWCRRHVSCRPSNVRFCSSCLQVICFIVKHQPFPTPTPTPTVILRVL